MAISEYLENISNGFKVGIATHHAIYTERTLVIDRKIIKQIAEKLRLTFINEEGTNIEGEVCFAQSQEVRPEFRIVFTQMDALDYIYAILYSSAYHKKFKEYLNADLKGIPIPTDTTIFWNLVKLGSKLREIHKLENPLVETNVALQESDKIIKEIDNILIKTD